LEEVWLKNPKYARYINKDLLETYYPVGGVRIEDDILVTEDGYENLTTAPKGEAALDIINEETEKEVKDRPRRLWFW
jgi:Xaa-Pro dipeptidase